MINVGDNVRSYDFEGRTDCYVEGIVEAIGREPDFSDCDRYRIRVARRVSRGEVLARDVTPTHIFPPVNGTPKLMGGECNGVHKIEAGQ